MPPLQDRLRNRIIRAYTTPGHPIAYSSPGRVAKHFHISTKKAKEILEHIEGYTLHREYKNPKQYNPYYVHGRREQIQGDLIDMAAISNNNNGVKFLLVLIDIFTKRLWVYPLQNKNARTVTQAMQRWLNSLDVIPKKIMTDKGTEFTNRSVQQLLRSHNVEWQAAIGTVKACIAERVNKTLQILIYKHLTENETLQYMNVLQDLVKTYNKRGHRTLEEMTPKEADLPQNEARVQAIFHARYDVLGRQRKTPRFAIGNLVRIKTLPKKISNASRAYAEQFKGEYFNIMRINRTLPIPLYYLRSADTGEMIEGGFYGNELQRIRGDLYKIENIIRERVRRGRRELFVKWKYFGPRWNEWIPAANVARVF